MLKRITRTVQIFPFIYSALYIAVFVAYNFASDSALDILDALFYISPIVILAHIAYSYILKLCRWHRIACSLPLIAQAVNLIDSYIYEFSQQEIIIIHIITILLIILYLIAVYKVFFTNNGRKTEARNSRTDSERDI